MLWLANFKEEDASTNPAALPMLDDVDVKEFFDLLEEASLTVAQERKHNKSHKPVLEALQHRLFFREHFLRLVSDISMPVKKRHEHLEQALSLLVSIVETMDLGKPSNGAFSSRIQRKLSICTPPRPMVAIDPKEAAKGMKKLLEILIEIDAIEEYKTSHEIWVISFLTMLIRTFLIISPLKSLLHLHMRDLCFRYLH